MEVNRVGQQHREAQEKAALAGAELGAATGAETPRPLRERSNRIDRGASFKPPSSGSAHEA